MVVVLVAGGEELAVLGMAVEAEEVVKATSKTSTNRSSNPLHRLRGRDVHIGTSMSKRMKRRRLRRTGAGVCAVVVEFSEQIEEWEEKERERNLCRELSQ